MLFTTAQTEASKMVHRFLQDADNKIHEHDTMFTDYLEKTVDPGIALFIFTLLYCLWSICLIPMLSILYDRYRKRGKKRNSELKETIREEISEIENTMKEDSKIPRTIDSTTGIHRVEMTPMSIPKFIFNEDENENGASTGASVSSEVTLMTELGEYVTNVLETGAIKKKSRRKSRHLVRKFSGYDSIQSDAPERVVDITGDESLSIIEGSNDGDEKSNIYTSNVHSHTIQVKPFEIEVISKSKYASNFEANVESGYSDGDAEDLHICFGKNALWRKKTILKAWKNLKSIAKFDNETRQIMKLAIPYTVGEVVENVFEMVLFALIGKFIGTKALSAYAVVETLFEITNEFISGVIDACATVVPHCVGTGNNYLAGQYVQMSTCLYLMASLPVAFIWWYFIYDAIIWFGFDDEVASMGEAYGRIALAVMGIDGVGNTFELFLEVTGFEVFATILGISGALVETCVIAGVLVLRDDMDLLKVAYIDLGLSFAYTFVVFIIPISLGWISEYMEGLFCNFALKNIPALKNLIMTALPLSISAVLAYGEWELLTIFAVHMGPAEVAAWAVLGSIWDTFEASTEAIGDSAEVRVGYHLGKGNPSMARTSAYKSLLCGTSTGIIISLVLLSIQNNLSTWFTDDETIQKMIKSIIPFIALGNITMTFGMVCWAIIGAQGRYRLATIIAFITSWSIVVPAAAVMTYGLSFNLKGLAASLLLGYTMTAMCMAVVILKSNWAEASRKIIAINAIIGEVESSDDDRSKSSRDSLFDSSQSSSSSNSDSSSVVLEVFDENSTQSETDSS